MTSKLRKGFRVIGYDGNARAASRLVHESHGHKIFAEYASELDALRALERWLLNHRPETSYVGPRATDTAYGSFFVSAWLEYFGPLGPRILRRYVSERTTDGRGFRWLKVVG